MQSHIIPYKARNNSRLHLPKYCSDLAQQISRLLHSNESLPGCRISINCVAEGLMQSLMQGDMSPSSTTDSELSDSFVCDMTSASEPLYGDPGEEEAYQY